jgi:hypothetical protein
MFHIDNEKKDVHLVLATIDLYRLLSITTYCNHGTTSNKSLSKPYVLFNVKCQLLNPISKTNLNLLNRILK